MYYKYLMRRCNSDAQMSHDIGHAHNSTHRMRLSPGSLRDPNGKGCIHVRCRMNAASSRWSYETVTNTLGSAVEQLAAWQEANKSAVEVKVQQSVKPVQSVKMPYEYLITMSNGARVSLHMSHDIGHAHSSTYRMQHSPGSGPAPYM